MIGYLKSLISGKPAPVSQASPTFAVPQSLPNIPSITAGPILKQAGISASPEMAQASPSHYLNHVLNEQPDGPAATQFMAHGMKPETGLNWATDSCEVVADKLAPADRDAFVAAKRFRAAPTPANQRLASLKADHAGYQGPGAWAALAARTYPGTGDVGKTAMPAATAPGLFPKSVAGAVSMAALTKAKGSSTPAVPIVSAPTLGKNLASQSPPVVAPTAAEKAETLQAMKPFLDQGLQLAAGK